jgi:capsule polysaccharide export protein KpsE/RkpR
MGGRWLHDRGNGYKTIRCGDRGTVAHPGPDRVSALEAENQRLRESFRLLERAFRAAVTSNRKLRADNKRLSEAVVQLADIAQAAVARSKRLVETLSDAAWERLALLQTYTSRNRMVN